ncbi:MAG: DUF262 domain-containing protein [Gaiellaceae bacterium]
MDTPSPTELSVRSESIQRLYGLYVNDRFRVNRRYQRKLVWSVEEKQRLIDSITRDLPIPLFLVAELSAAEGTFELIDGMQRLNAVFSFLENEFPLNEEYFDLNALADTKLRLDRGEFVQREPVMERTAAVSVANYSIALSVFRAPNSSSVDEVFRRINSGGRTLSRQGLRQAGTTSTIADLVRRVASKVRGDTSPGDIVPLRAMGRLSISNRELEYGVQVDEIFWVREGILRREDVRESIDEQVLLDLVVDCVSDPLPTTGSRQRDEYYSYTDFGDADEPTPLARELNLKIEAYGIERLERDVLRVYDELRSVLREADERFSRLIGLGGGGRAPRYFHAVFIPIFELVIRGGMRAKSYAAVAETLRNITTGPLNVPGGGGDWAKEVKRTTFDAVKGVLTGSFEPAPDGEDLGRFGRATEFETLLGNALVEQQLFDCKQGFLSLGSSRVFDEESFEKICRTLTAMANGGPGHVGYVVVGVADDVADAQRVVELDTVTPIVYRGFHVVGIEREASLRSDTLNDYWSWVMQRLRTGLPGPFGPSVTAESRFVGYIDKAVLLLKAHGGQAPVFFGDELYERSGSDTVRVDTAEYMRVFSRFQSV